MKNIIERIIFCNLWVWRLFVVLVAVPLLIVAVFFDSLFQAIEEFSKVFVYEYKKDFKEFTLSKARYDAMYKRIYESKIKC